MQDFSKQHARAWVEEIKVKMREDIKHSILGTKEYSAPPQVETCKKTSSILLPMTSTDALFYRPWPGKICALNFASYRNPGGGFLSGMQSQEEALCHESDLYLVLLAFRNTFYEWNRKNLNRSLYFDRALYSPDIVFKRDGRQIKADVLTCAAPNWEAAMRRLGVSTEENKEAVRDRVAFMASILAEQGVDTFIAGAWGCGVFGQDPKMMASEMIDGILAPNVIYAIPEGHNYDMFERMIGVKVEKEEE